MSRKARRSGVGRRDRSELETALRRARVLDAAVAEFAEQGFDGAQMGVIAARAEVSVAETLALFDSREHLLASAIEKTTREAFDAVRQAVESVRHPHERLLALVDSLSANLDENHDLLRVYAQRRPGLPLAVRRCIEERVRPIIVSFDEWVLALTIDATKTVPLKGVDAEALAYTLIGAVTTAAATAAEAGASRPLDVAAGHVRGVIERLIGPVGGN